jgi:hypothetical protein
VAWKAEDVNGNAEIKIQKITVKDETAPELTIPGDITVEATERRMHINIGEPTVYDIFDVLVSNNAPLDYPVGTTKITWTAIDENGNKTVKYQYIQ